MPRKQTARYHSVIRLPIGEMHMKRKFAWFLFALSLGTTAAHAGNPDLCWKFYRVCDPYVSDCWAEYEACLAS